MTKVTISTVGVMLCASFASGAAGDLTFMKQPPLTRSSARVSVSGLAHCGVDKERGLVSEHSVVGAVQGGLVRLSVAIDSAQASADHPDLLRLDFSGKGQFKGVPTAPIKMRPPQKGTTMGEIGPVVVVVKRDGRSIPVSIRGVYWTQKKSKNLSLMVASAVEGSCKFGEKTYPVRVFDGNINLGFSDALKPPFRTMSIVSADRVVVDTGDGKFAGATTTSYIGQPIFIDGKWYSIDVSDMKVKASVMKIADGSIKVDAPRWKCTLIGKKYYLSLSGGKEPIDAPADEYHTGPYAVFAGGDPRKICAVISGDGSYRGGKAFTVASGKCVDFPIGAPIEATVSALKRAGKVNMNLVMKDALGGRIRSVTTSGGARPTAPSIEVIDKAGKIVYTAKLKYG